MISVGGGSVPVPGFSSPLAIAAGTMAQTMVKARSSDRSLRVKVLITYTSLFCFRWFLEPFAVPAGQSTRWG